MEASIDLWLPGNKIKPKLLVVDDQAVNIRVIYELFQENCELFMARDGDQALQLAKSVMPDLILLDVVMPGVSGYAVCRELKADVSTRHIPVIFITGNITEADEMKGFALGAVDFIRKPINPVVTKARVRNHLLIKCQADKLAKIALTDGLTDVANRRCFDQEIAKAWRRCAREKANLSVLLVDVDYFKRYNDRFGHQAGDDCLRTVAKALSSVIQRPGDLVARYGGEEFGCLLTHADEQGARHVAHLCLEAVRALDINHPDSEVCDHITVSIGLATIMPAIDSDASEMLVAAADKQLYQAKHRGRNQVCG